MWSEWAWRAVAVVDPPAVVLTIACAAALWGITGAFLVVPSLAVATAVVGSLNGDRDRFSSHVQETSPEPR